VRVARPFVIDAWVLLPDHLHCMRTLSDGDTGFSTRWMKIKRAILWPAEKIIVVPTGWLHQNSNIANPLSGDGYSGNTKFVVKMILSAMSITFI